MLISEFTQRTGVEVSYSEYDSINNVYNHSFLDKDAFCKQWCKMNADRVKKAKAEAKKRAEMAAVRDYLWELFLGKKFGAIKYAGWWFEKDATEILSKRDIKNLEKAGIKVENRYRSKRVNEVYGDLRDFF